MLVPFICPLKGRIDIENDPDVVEQLVLNDLPDLEFCFLLRHGDHRSRIRGCLTAMYNLMAMHSLAVVVPLVAVAAVCQGEALEERQGLQVGDQEVAEAHPRTNRRTAGRLSHRSRARSRDRQGRRRGSSRGGWRDTGAAGSRRPSGIRESPSREA